MSTVQMDWIEHLPEVSAADLSAIDDSLSYFPDYSVGRDVLIREHLLSHRAALLGQCHKGAAIPADVRFMESYRPFKLDAAGRPAECHAWAISDSFMEMAGGCGATPEQARARAMVGLMLQINEAST